MDVVLIVMSDLRASWNIITHAGQGFAKCRSASNKHLCGYRVAGILGI